MERRTPHPKIAKFFVAVFWNPERLGVERGSDPSETFGKLFELFGEDFRGFVLSNFGEPSIFSEIFEFRVDYYKREMGEKLYKFFVVFQNLCDPLLLADLKRVSDEVERKLTRDGGRTVNIDPGYITLGSVVLASRKWVFHRIPIAPDIFADLHLVFISGTFRALPWTYSDYREHIGFFNDVRKVLKRELAGRF